MYSATYGVDDTHYPFHTERKRGSCSFLFCSWTNNACMHELGWKQLTQSVDDDYYTLRQMAASLTDEEFLLIHQ